MFFYATVLPFSCYRHRIVCPHAAGSTLPGSTVLRIASPAKFRSSNTLTWQHLCFSANTGRTHFAQAQRLAAVAAGREELHDRLEGFARGAQPAEVGLHVSAAEASPTRRRNQAKTAFLFTGQGAQYFGMGRRLYETQPAFRATPDAIAAKNPQA